MPSTGFGVYVVQIERGYRRKNNSSLAVTGGRYFRFEAGARRARRGSTCSPMRPQPVKRELRRQSCIFVDSRVTVALCVYMVVVLGSSRATRKAYCTFFHTVSRLPRLARNPAALMTRPAVFRSFGLLPSKPSCLYIATEVIVSGNSLANLSRRSQTDSGGRSMTSPPGFFSRRSAGWIRPVLSFVLRAMS